MLYAHASLTPKKSPSYTYRGVNQQRTPRSSCVGIRKQKVKLFVKIGDMATAEGPGHRVHSA